MSWRLSFAPQLLFCDPTGDNMKFASSQRQLRRGRVNSLPVRRVNITELNMSLHHEERTSYRNSKVHAMSRLSKRGND